ncbi:hypothetical protein B0T26DRAFT_673415 [Lasiosphaeria miniovina]|uniref:Uncharacterized protein n=1 Tax=Lasiosphaeria miniovina TaxID=1954250 RepID=A0AA40E1M0_9PEZI|nr:uncharacterized protein B0T26DRAFT_673415 [Lasiosphaeria miniovina]KAK0721612.1 hypothetical protein B0T26DRAFT_673415 [Lasiosphaeria miniovina]
MSILVPLLESGFTAIYYSKIGILKVFASGEILGWIINPHLEQAQDFVEGLKFLLLSSAGSSGIKPAQSLQASIEVKINPPNGPIYTIPVTCESADGNFGILATVDDQKVEYPPAGSNFVSLAKGSHLEASIAIEILLPREDFQSRVVTYQTEDGIFEIPIVYHDVNKDSDAATVQKEPTPGSILVPLPESGFKAVYVTKTKTLTVFAGRKRDVLFGGLKFSLRGFPGGFPETSEQVIETWIKLHISLPAEHFQSDTVTCQSATGTYHVNINSAGLDGQSKDSKKAISVTIDGRFGDHRRPPRRPLRPSR